jgi:Polysaccharide biosynthesis enzyme WcbI
VSAIEPTTDEDGRRSHYSDFYDGSNARGATVVLGNCQAESLRIALASDDLPTVRIPPVHELTAADLPHLDAILGRASVVISQPIRDNYRDLPLGTRQVAARLGAATRMAVIPAIRHRALQPTHVVVRRPDGPVEDPPIVVYHDLRTLAEALGYRPAELSRDAILAIASASTIELQRREQSSDAVAISDFFARPDFSMMRTMNHPGNPVWIELALRVRRRLGLAETATDPGRELLSSVIAPREQVVIDTWGLSDAPDRFWHVDGVAVSVEQVTEAHRRWYELHPAMLELAAARHADALRELAAA